MDPDILERARAGDHDAFRALTDPYRHELQVHCYRMLGSLTDAEDVLQETLLAAWRGLGGFAGRSSLRTWLYRIATNRCLNAMRDNARRRPPEPDPPFDPPEPSRRSTVTWLEPYPDRLLDRVAAPAAGPEARYHARESVELAFVAGLQHLPPRQSAVLLLRDVLGFPADEVAAMLGTSATAVKGALQRAREQLRRHRIDRESVELPDSPRERELTARFAEAFTAGDVAAVIALLTDDAWLTMPPAPHEYHGLPAIGAFLTVFTTWRGARRLHLVETRANTRPALACYLTDTDPHTAHPAGVLVLTVGPTAIHHVTWFLAADLRTHFALPATVPVG
ncbi:RNA polymerase subunit sigma-70 [Nocardia farcinica]|uniref:RNA polymerase subunit sigma-70 n=1 Tax=Nocardia farcinica TaxID=37329 RepID=UPI0015F0663C|nr:RNA polymerase subunit sigma-70 [Nocardia farcinica]MBA4856117.1 RNA polymerase subunit sigma-70 [Nocardia farcinica]MBC9816326.1 RNA polymerase subunit sigma-70 [Nocardia farcinica]